MIDLHAHILPGVDDGSRNLETSLEMAMLAWDGGTKIMTATPHCCCLSRRPNLWDREHRSRIRALRAALAEERIPLKILPGMEIMGTDQVPELLKAGEMIGLNRSRYPLIEFPFDDDPDHATAILEQVLKLEMRPLVAHPERYYFTQRDPRVLNRWVRLGCLLQVNKDSLLGRFGPDELALGWELAGRGFAYVLASDTHSSHGRTPGMEELARQVERRFGSIAVRKMLIEHPGNILKDRPIRIREPEWF